MTEATWDLNHILAKVDPADQLPLQMLVERIKEMEHSCRKVTRYAS